MGFQFGGEAAVTGRLLGARECLRLKGQTSAALRPVAAVREGLLFSLIVPKSRSTHQLTSLTLGRTRRTVLCTSQPVVDQAGASTGGGFPRGGQRLR